MAGDATIQAAYQTLIRAMTRYGTADVTLGDFQCLGNGSGPWCVILPGPFESEREGDYGQVRYYWTHYLELWRKFDGDDYADVVADRQDVLDTIAIYPTLNGTANVSDATAVAGDRPMYMWMRGQSRDSKPALVGFLITARCIELRGYTTGEFST